MLPKIVEETFNRVRKTGDNFAIKIETPDVVRTTHEIIDMIMLYNNNEAPALYLITADKIKQYLWDKGDWDNPKELPIEESLKIIENSKNTFAVFIFWDIAPILNENENFNHAVRSFIPHFFLSPKATRKLLIFLEPLGTKYPNLIAPYVISVSEHYPSKDELTPMIKREAKLAQIEINEAEIASALLGLTYTRAQQMIRFSFEKFKGAGNFQKEILNYLYREKEELLSQTLGMSILKPTSDDIPYGLDFLMKDLEIHRSLICVPGQNREKGWLLIGPPGTGKSLVAKYLGYQLGYPAISFNISSIMNSLLGETERNMYNLCKVLETFAPCVLYIDEFEKALGGSGYELDGGTMTRAIGILLTWLNDTNAPIFLLASANNLDPTHGYALTRRGRFSQVYWVGEPCYSARYEICKANFEKKGFKVKEEILKELAENTCYFTGADLTWLVNEIITEAKHYKFTPDDPQFRNRLMELVKENKERVQIIKAQYDPLRAWAKAYCKPAGPPPES
jgi:hypothetical protein